mgnify:CR=1 FL=1
MKILFLPECRADLRWFKRYYTSIFTEGRERADRQFLTARKLLKTNPFIGHPVDGLEEVRAHHLPRTPFTILYRLRKDRIEILRILDNRSDQGSL